jgi:hypothetical protein
MADAPTSAPTGTRPEAVHFVEVIRSSVLTQEANRLAAVARMMNAFNGYLTNVSGRPLDQLTTSDIMRLGTILKALDELEGQERVAHRGSELRRANA